MTGETWHPDEPDELDRRYRALEAERLRPVPKAFTSRAHGSDYNALTRGFEAALSRSDPPCDPQGKPLTLKESDDDSEAAARRRAALLEELGDGPEEED